MFSNSITVIEDNDSGIETEFILIVPLSERCSTLIVNAEADAGEYTPITN